MTPPWGSLWESPKKPIKPYEGIIYDSLKVIYKGNYGFFITFFHQKLQWIGLGP